jgi:hypothetical protein
VLVLRSSVLVHGWTVKVTARVRYLRSTTETERKPAQGADDVLKLCQPTLCLDLRQLTASLSLIGCTSLLAESGILRTQAGGDGSGDGHTLPRDAPDQALRLRPRLRALPPPPAPGSPGAAGPVALITSPGHCQAGTACPTAGVARSAGHSRAGKRA